MSDKTLNLEDFALVIAYEGLKTVQYDGEPTLVSGPVTIYSHGKPVGVLSSFELKIAAGQRNVPVVRCEFAQGLDPEKVAGEIKVAILEHVARLKTAIPWAEVKSPWDQ
jgi:hypothetical protein